MEIIAHKPTNHKEKPDLKREKSRSSQHPNPKADYNDRNPHPSRVDAPTPSRIPLRPELSCSKGGVGSLQKQSDGQGRESERDHSVAKRR
ncbi:unnamed protein product [Brassica rapa]|nr:unnamed protein product [Brassica napus]CAG7896887.1 unnamed protein product [Brassica rapa]